MFEQKTNRQGVSIVSLREGEKWEGYYINRPTVKTFIKMVVGLNKLKDGRYKVIGPAIFEKHNHIFQLMN